MSAPWTASGRFERLGMPLRCPGRLLAQRKRLKDRLTRLRMGPAYSSGQLSAGCAGTRRNAGVIFLNSIGRPAFESDPEGNLRPKQSTWGSRAEVKLTVCDVSPYPLYGCRSLTYNTICLFLTRSTCPRQDEPQGSKCTLRVDNQYAKRREAEPGTDPGVFGSERGSRV